MQKVLQTASKVPPNVLTTKEDFEISKDSDRSALETCGWKVRRQEEKDRLTLGGKRQIDHENSKFEF